MATGSFDVARYGTLYDVQYDFMAQRLAAGFADGVVRIFSSDMHELITELRGHRKPVLSVAWGQGGRFSSLMASGSEDGQVFIWREERPGAFEQFHAFNITSAANTVAFAPSDFGLVLGVAGGDELGVITIKTMPSKPMQSGGQQWQARSFPGHPGGVTALSWAPSTSAATLASGPAVNRATTLAPCRFVTGGEDGQACVWLRDDKTDTWALDCSLDVASLSTSAIRDVAWRPNLGIPSSVIATCQQDGTVAIWTQDIGGMPWRQQCHWNVNGDARRLTWSKAGTVLGVSVGDADTFLYQATKTGPWIAIESN